MTLQEVSGKNFSATQNVDKNGTQRSIEVYLESLAHQGTKWVVNGQYTVSPDPSLVDVVGPIREDQRAGKASKIHCVLVRPHTFNRLFLLGQITFAQLKKAVEDEAAQTITVSGVSLNGGSFRVRTMAPSRMNQLYGDGAMVVTLDKHGNIV